MDTTVVAIAGDGDDSFRRPLLAHTEEIHPYEEPPSSQRAPLDAAAAQPEQQRKSLRVASLDVFRGFTVAVSGDSIRLTLLIPRPPSGFGQVGSNSDCVRR
jgi:heparan-alpha-glucosaminide N-acetyltransferase